MLLDPARRAEHDAALAQEEREPDAPAEPDEPSEPAGVAPAADAPASKPAASASRLPLVPGWALVVLAVLAVLSVGAATLVWAQPNERVVASANGGNEIEESAEQARAVAERAVGPVLSYDYLVMAGTQGMRGHRKTDRLLDVVERLSLPCVFFAAGGGGRPGAGGGGGAGAVPPNNSG